MPKQKKLRSGNAKNDLPPVPPPKDKQAALNELVYQHGTNLRNWDQPRIEALRGAGLDPDSIKDIHWDRAESALESRVKAEANGKKIEWPLKPVEEDWHTCKVSRWQSLCGRYNIIRFNRETKPGEFTFNYGAEFGKTGKSQSVETDKDLGPGYAKYYDTLRDAVNAVIRKHLKEFKLDFVKGNTDEMVESEPEFRSECLPSVDSSATMVSEEATTASPETQTQPSTEGEVPEMPAVKEALATVSLKEASVRKMFQAMGMPEDGWSLKTLQKKLSDKEKFAGYASTGKTPDEGTKERVTFDKVMEAFSDGIPVEIKPTEGGAETNGHGEPKDKSEAKKAPAAKSEAKPAKEGKGRDKFGSLLGSQAATINAAVTAKQKSIEQICTDSGLAAARVRSHLKWMEENGHAVKGEKGYSLKK